MTYCIDKLHTTGNVIIDDEVTFVDQYLKMINKKSFGCFIFIKYPFEILYIVIDFTFLFDEGGLHFGPSKVGAPAEAT